MKYLFILHRYLGVVVGLIMLMWCLSGFVMMYQSFPDMTQDEVYAGRDAINLADCCALDRIGGARVSSHEHRSPRSQARKHHDHTPAVRSGLREGDVITAVQGLSLLLALDGDMENGFDSDRSIPVQRLQVLAGSLEPGDEVEVSYERDGQSHISTLVAEAAPSRAVRLELEGLPEFVSV